VAEILVEPLLEAARALLAGRSGGVPPSVSRG